MPEISKELFSDISSFYEALKDVIANQNPDMTITASNDGLLLIVVDSLIGKVKKKFKFTIQLKRKKTNHGEVGADSNIDELLTLILRQNDIIEDQAKKIKELETKSDLQIQLLEELKQGIHVFYKRLFACKECKKDVEEFNYCNSCSKALF